MEIAIVWIGVAIACAIVASNKGRSAFGWLLLGILFSLIALLIVICLPSLKIDPDAPTEETHAKCPFCAEYIRREAVKCKHCGEAVTPKPIPTAALAPQPDPHAREAELLGASRDGSFWSFQGRAFADAKDVIAFAKQSRA